MSGSSDPKYLQQRRKAPRCHFRRSEGSFGENTFGFEEQYFSDEPLERCWCPLSQVPLSFCETEEIAVREAHARVVWLKEEA